MKSLGIELKGNTCIGVLINDSSSIEKSLKIELKDSYDKSSVEEFFNEFKLFTQSNQVDSLVVKKRNEKGKFAGGPVSFKMEGLIQISAPVNATFVTGAQLKAYSNKLIEFPDVKKYQTQALFCALFGLKL